MDSNNDTGLGKAVCRRELFAFAAAAATLLVPKWAQAAAQSRKPRQERILSLYNLHTGESVKACYWADGKYLGSEMKSIWRVLRDHRTDETHPIAPEVFDLLHALQRKLRTSQPFQIISGYRSPVTNAMLAEHSDGVANHSLHMVGKAVDVRIQGQSVRTIGRAALQLKKGGVGMYPRSNFVHVDVGPVRRW